VTVDELVRRVPILRLSPSYWTVDNGLGATATATYAAASDLGTQGQVCSGASNDHLPCDGASDCPGGAEQTFSLISLHLPSGLPGSRSALMLTLQTGEFQQWINGFCENQQGSNFHTDSRQRAGHSSLATTQRYIDVTPDQERKAVRMIQL
jgi:hypothetical protein